MSGPLTSSSIPAVRLALRTALRARLSGLPAFATVRVEIGPPLPNWPDEAVWIADVTDGAQAPRGARRDAHRRRETYTVQVIVFAYQAVDDQVLVDARGFAIVREIELYLRAKAQLEDAFAGDARILSATFAGVQRAEQLVGDGRREARLTCAVAITADI